MSFVEVLNMKLQRTDANVSWGFNVQGGKEFNCPLMIQKINPGSLAERCSIRTGDYILRIGSLSTEHLTHNQARDSIIRQGNVLELTLQRGAVPRPDDFVAKLDFPQHQLMTPEAIQPPTLSPQVGVQLGRNKALLTQSYNSPMGLYSSQNIADTLVNSMKKGLACSSHSGMSSMSSSPVSNLSSSLHDLTAANALWNPKPFSLKKTPVFKEMNVSSSPGIKQCNLIVTSSPKLELKVCKETENNTFRAVPLHMEKNQQNDSKWKPQKIGKQVYINSDSIPNYIDRIPTSTVAANDPLKHVKLSLMSELQSRLNPHMRRNKENTVMNGRLFQTPQTRKSVDYGSGLNNNKSSEEINRNTPTQARRNQSMGNIFRRLDESLTRTEKQLGSQNNLLNLSIDQEADLSARQATSTQIPRRTVATLSDPSKPSSTQSRTFRLLQQTLDCELKRLVGKQYLKDTFNRKGLEENDLLVYDVFHKRNQLRRCSLKPNTDPTKFIQSASCLIDKESSRRASIQSTSCDETNEIIDDIEDEKLLRKQYIRSLSIARDPDAEPLFLSKRLGSSRHSIAFIDETKNETEAKTNVNVSDPRAVQAAAQHITPKAPAFTSTHTLHTSPNSALNVKTTSYSISNMNNQFGTASNSASSASNYPPTTQPQYHHHQHQQQPVRAQQPFYPPHHNNFSIPEFTPVRPPPPPPPASQFASFAAAQPAKPYGQVHYQPPSPAPHRPAPSAAAASSPAPPHKSKNLKNFIGGNRGSLGSHILNAAVTSNMPACNACHALIRGPFISAIGKVFCPNHFVCAQPSCGVSLEHASFVEEEGRLYCERDFQLYFAPSCYKCQTSIMGECVNALEKSFHPECFLCHHCKAKLGSGTFHMEDGHPYCQKDFAALFAQKCAGCEFPIEAGDNFYEAISQLWHVECFTCQTCHVPLQASGFCVKGTKPYCKKHAF